ncbi:MAG: SDR family NAD(P)-dependent oxidoreductase [Acidimicrobiia bacterium]
MQLDGRVAMVTGAGRGIGAATALRLGGLGATVVVCDLDETAGGEAVAAVEAAGGKAAFRKLDVSDSAAVKATVADIASTIGPVDILVNNAGIDIIEPFVKSTEDTWDRIIAVNLKGAIMCCRAVLDSMIERKTGTIINLGSDAGRVGSSGEAVYSATKGGIIAFTKTLAREMARNGIRVNCVCPGPTETALLAQLGDSSGGLRQALEKSIPMRRVAQPDDIAAMVAFLATDDCSYVTGQTISVNGGLTMS